METLARSTHITVTADTGTLEYSVSGRDAYQFRQGLKAAGGRWVPAIKTWVVPHGPASEAIIAECIACAKQTKTETSTTSTAAAPDHTRGAPKPAATTPDPETVRRLLEALGVGAGYDAERVDKAISEALEPVWDTINSIGQPKPLEVEVTCEGETVRKIEGRPHAMFPTLLDCLDAGLHVWLTGPSQAGKTTGARMAAKALGLAFDFHGSMTMPHELVGFVDAGGKYHETAFVRAFRNGGLVLLDEIDGGTSEAVLPLNAPLANGIMSLPNGEVIEAHPAFRCIGAANTHGMGANAEYVGRNRLDGAFLQRFGASIAWGYDNELEQEICGNREWAMRVQRARKRAAEAGLKVLITPKASLSGAALIARKGFTFDQAAELTYLRGLTPDQVNLIGG